MKVQELDSTHIEFLSNLRVAEGEAVEAYGYALPRIEDDDVAERLAPIHSHHRMALDEVRDLLRGADAEADEGESGTWGAFAVHLKGLASMLGDTGLLATLAAAERHAVKLYRAALENDDLQEGLRRQIAETYLPRQEENQRVLDELMWTTRPPDEV